MAFYGYARVSSFDQDLAIQEEKLRNHYFNSDFAILYRTNAQSRSYEESLRRMNIAYRIYGGLSFYQRKEIKDYVAYLRMVVNPNDEEALKRIINYPTRGIGKTSMDRAVLAANENNITLWEVLMKAASFGYKGGTLEAINNSSKVVNSTPTPSIFTVLKNSATFCSNFNLSVESR